MAGRRRFKRSDDIRRYLASLLNRIETQELDPVTASKCAFISNILLRAIESSDIEARLSEIEKRLANR
jgi:hypothetical protein